MAGEGIVTEIIRKILNSSLQGTTPDQLIEAVQTNASLLGNAHDQIHHYAAYVPPIAMTMASRQLNRLEKTYNGGIVGLVMDWLVEDQPIYHSLLLNTDGGKEWLEAQVFEILNEFGITVKR
ncbi:MAG: hypothetical protein WCR85_00125 [Sphaerochaeta sp.]